jgi:hypothetical protein
LASKNRQSDQLAELRQRMFHGHDLVNRALMLSFAIEAAQGRLTKLILVSGAGI